MFKQLIFFLLLTIQIHAMELEEIVIEGKQEEQEVEESRVPSLKLLAARVCAEKYKKLPGQAVPKECIPYIKLYLPITEDSVYEQYALAREFGDQKRIKECREKIIETKAVNWWEFNKSFIPTVKSLAKNHPNISKDIDPVLKKHNEFIASLNDHALKESNEYNDKEIQTLHSELQQKSLENLNCSSNTYLCCGAMCCKTCIVGGFVYLVLLFIQHTE